MPSAAYEPASECLDGLNIIQAPPVTKLGYQTPPPQESPIEPEQQQQQQSEESHRSVVDSPDSPSSRKTPSPLRRRRSVSSMKGLMPLTLSSASSISSASTTNVPSEDGMTERVDDYFPEVLARDLELASAVFAARSMTAGPPSCSVAAEYMARAKAAGIFTQRATSPYHMASARVQLLGPIEERDSIVSFLEQQQQQQQESHDSFEDSNSDLDTTSSAEESGGLPPPSFRYRNHSVVTNATSVEDANWKTSPKPSPPPSENLQDPPDCIWIEGESDDESEQHTDNEMILEPLSPLSPRPPTPPTTSNDPASSKVEATPGNFRMRILHRKAHSVGGGSPIVSPLFQFAKQPLGTKLGGAPPKKREAPEHITIQTPKMSAPMAHEPATQPSPIESALSPSLVGSPPPVPQKHKQRLTAAARPGTAGKVNQVPRHVHIVAEPSPVSDEFPESDECESIMEPEQSIWSRNEINHSRPTPPPSPLPSIQPWAPSNIKPYAPPFLGEELARVVPLPPDVIETLRVSVTCFPETMLLSSSLTIETIRSYSKKMRHPNMDIFKSSPPPSPSSGSRKSLWKKVNPLKRASSASLRADMHSMNGSVAHSVGVGASVAASNPLKNVFSCCSDYICDALYAHIVAYNYISALVARMPPPPIKRMLSNAGRMSSEHQPQQQQDSIPRKAASLLGLGGGDGGMAGRESMPSRSGRLTKRVSGQLAPWPREEMVASQSASSANHDNAVRAIHAGLLKCIARLISTARLMSESGRIEERPMEMDHEDTDMLFKRSLCELVRMAEEAS